MREDAKEGREVDMVQNFNLATFDIISDLSFGESFGGLRIRTAHPWIKAFYDIATIGTIMTQLVLLKNSHNLDTSGSASLAHVEEAARDYQLY